MADVPQGGAVWAGLSIITFQQTEVLDNEAYYYVCAMLAHHVIQAVTVCLCRTDAAMLGRAGGRCQLLRLDNHHHGVRARLEHSGATVHASGSPSLTDQAARTRGIDRTTSPFATSLFLSYNYAFSHPHKLALPRTNWYVIYAGHGGCGWCLRLGWDGARLFFIDGRYNRDVQRDQTYYVSTLLASHDRSYVCCTVHRCHTHTPDPENRRCFISVLITI